MNDGDKEKRIQLWFTMWLQKKDLGIRDIFAADAVYIESWGPEYHGAEEIQHWFTEWNTRGSVLVWDSGQYFHKENQTVVEWSFQCQMNGERPSGFDGVSLIRWAEDGKIQLLKEFGCKADTYDPYQNGPVPVFKEEGAGWL